MILARLPRWRHDTVSNDGGAFYKCNARFISDERYAAMPSHIKHRLACVTGSAELLRAASLDLQLVPKRPSYLLD